MMRTKLSVAFSAVCLLGLVLTNHAFAAAADGFYDKGNIRGFISLAGDYRNMNSEFKNYINQLLFSSGANTVTDSAGKVTDTIYDASLTRYDHFDDYYMGLHVQFGAQYKQFLTWFDVNFMPTQISEKPADYNAYGNRLYDASWFAYGLDWMFGWKLFGENAVINLIPAAGFGLNLLNVHFASNYDYPYTDGSGWVQLRNRYYSTFASTFNAELELRLNLDPFSIGGYGGYRVIRYEPISISEGSDDTTGLLGDPDMSGDTWFVGVKLTWTFLSDTQRKLRDKL